MTKPTDVLNVQPAGVVAGVPTPAIAGQWRRDEQDISGATGTDYTVADADFNSLIDYQETATNSQGTASSASNTIPVDASKPIATTAPFVVASENPPVAGTVFTATDGVYIGSQPIIIARQWLADGVAIVGATGATYTAVAGDVGKTITYRETATNTLDSTVTIIDPMFGSVQGPLLPSLTTAPTITTSDDPPLIGSVLTRTVGVWANADNTSGEWHVNGIPTGNTTATYTTVASDEFDIVTWKEHATNTDGLAIGTSNEIGPIEAVKNYTFVSRNTGGADAAITQSGAPAGQDDTIERFASASGSSQFVGVAGLYSSSFSTVGQKYSRCAELIVLDNPNPSSATVAASIYNWLFGVKLATTADNTNLTLSTATLPSMSLFGPSVRSEYSQATGLWNFIGAAAIDSDVFGMKVDFLPIGDPLGHAASLAIRCTFYKNGAIFASMVSGAGTVNASTKAYPQLTAASNAAAGRMRLVTKQTEMAHFASYGADYDFVDPPLQILTPPELLQEPAIAANPGRKSVVGTAITITPGQWSPQPGATGPVVLNGDVYAGGVVVPGTANATSYTPVAGDIGKLLTYRERGSLDGRVSDYWSSDPVGAVTAT